MKVCYVDRLENLMVYVYEDKDLPVPEDFPATIVFVDENGTKNTVPFSVNILQKQFNVWREVATKNKQIRSATLLKENVYGCIEDNIQNPGAHLWVYITKTNEIGGIVVFDKCMFEDLGIYVMINCFVIDPRLHGCGHGTRLVETIKKGHCSKKLCNGFYLLSYERVAPFWSKTGFSIIDYDDLPNSNTPGFIMCSKQALTGMLIMKHDFL